MPETAAPARKPKPPKPKKRRRKKQRQRRFEATEEQRNQVKAFATAGYGQDKISDYLSVDPKTLRKHFRKELDFAVMEVSALAAVGIVQLIQQKDLGAICFWFKTRGKKLHDGYGWSEGIEIGGPGGGAIPIRLSTLSDAQLTQLLMRLELYVQSSTANGGAPAPTDVPALPAPTP